MKIENYSAFPVALPDDHQNSAEGFIQHGLSKREYFAAKAMQGILSGMNCQEMVDHRATDSKGVIELCILMADTGIDQDQLKKLSLETSRAKTCPAPIDYQAEYKDAVNEIKELQDEIKSLREELRDRPV